MGQRLPLRHEDGSEGRTTGASSFRQEIIALGFIFSNGYSHDVFAVLISKDALRQMRRMPRNSERMILAKIEEVAIDPFAPHNNVTALTGSPGNFRLRVGDWRVLYRLDTGARRMTVGLIRTRGAAYR